MALAADRSILERASSFSMLHAPAVAASSVQFYKGSILCLNQATSTVVKASATTGLIALGRCEENVLTGASNTRYLKCRGGIYRYDNSAAADAIATDDVGKLCYLVDDCTVALTDGSAARSRAGVVYEVETGGVWVAFTFALSI